jgi:hypothetical protein
MGNTKLDYILIIGSVKTIVLLKTINVFQKGKRVSKVRVLQKAIDYIQNLHDVIQECDGVDTSLDRFVLNDADDSILFAF